MNAQQAQLLLPQTVVMRNNDPKDLGTVYRIEVNRVWIRWADGFVGPHCFDKMKHISHYNPTAEKGEK
jgi:hypothetical protein